METYFVDDHGWAATPWLRFVERDGQRILQQLMALPGRREIEWRDVPLTDDDGGFPPVPR